MATVIGIMDRDTGNQNTDVNVVVDPATRTLTWVPRDLYSPGLGDRINSVFRLGGNHSDYISEICKFGFDVSHSIVVWPRVINAAVKHLTIDVPVPKKMKFWYPLTPWVDLEDGKKLVVFSRPRDQLSGERIHQWLGARTSVNGKFDGDLNRCKRQQVLVRRLLETGFDFRTHFGGRATEEGVSKSSESATKDLALVRPDWTFKIMDDLEHQTIDGMWVFVRKPG